MIDVDRYDCDFSLEEQVEASEKHFADLGEAYNEMLERKSVPLLEIDKNFETILLCAVRYAIGRKTYMPSLVIDYITPLLSHLSYNTLGLIANDITEYGKYYGGLGDDKIDRPYWLNFKRKILAEMERRGNEDTEQMGKESH